MPTFYRVVSTCRSRHTRGVRRLNPTHEGLTQYVGGVHRLVRGRPVVLGEQQLRGMLPELKSKKAIGLLTVTTMQGAEVDLDTLVAEALPPPTPVPIVLPDSIARDDPPPFASLEPLPGTDPLDRPTEFKMPPTVGVDPTAPPVTAKVEEPEPAKEEPKPKKRRR
jgi:hypothetical protein